MPRPTLNLSLLADSFTVCRLPHDAAIPAWALDGAFFSITRTREELSIVCVESAVPPDITNARGWRGLKLEGPFDFALTGILTSVADPLAEAGISIFALATYDTDYVLVRGDALERVIAVLTDAGHNVRR